MTYYSADARDSTSYTMQSEGLRSGRQKGRAKEDKHMKNVLVRVFDGNGKPTQNARVNIHVYQFLASGQREQYTDSNGEAEFDLNIDDGAEISIGVNSTERVRRGSVKGSYRIQL